MGMCKLTGRILVVVGIGFFIRDIIIWAGSGPLVLSSAGEIWYSVNKESLLLAEAAIARHIPIIGPELWHPVISTILTAPIFLVILLPGLLIIFCLSYFGVETSRFNSVIKDQIKKQNKEIDIKLNTVKLHLDLKNLSIKIKTENPEVDIKNKKKIQIDEISSSISIQSYIKKNFSIKNIFIKTKSNDIINYLDFYKIINKKSQIIIASQFIKKGTAKFSTFINFDKNGKIINDYKFLGTVKNLEIRTLRQNINNINFNFEVKKSFYDLQKVEFELNEILFIADYLNIKQKNKSFFVEGNLKNKESKINKKLIKLFSIEKYINNLDFKNSKISSDSKFSFMINKKFKIKNIIFNSELNLDEIVLNYKINNINEYLKEFDENIIFKKNKFKINYKSNDFKLNGSSNFYIKDNKSNLINFNISNMNNKLSFKSLFKLTDIDIKLNNINYYKPNKNVASLEIEGSAKNNKFFLTNINYIENDNKILIKNLEIKNNKIIDFNKIVLNYLSKNDFKNQISVTKNKKNYLLSGKSFDSENLIETLSNSDDNKNFLNIFKNLNSKIDIKIENVKLDKFNEVKNLNGFLIVKNNKIVDLDIDSKFNDKEKLFFTIRKKKDNTVITNFYSDRAKPFVKKYKFIKGFEKGNIVYHSSKIGEITKSRLVIDNFKVKEIPILAKLLTLASLQGIADLLTGEGIRFTDFEMSYTNEKNLMTIDEIYAIGPAISIMMEGYVESNKLISLRGTLVPATTINRSISSIPLLGDLLVGKKVGEGVFGVSFKIKGPPKNLKTTVNPIKTLTPRFITRTLEKIKKN